MNWCSLYPVSVLGISVLRHLVIKVLIRNVLLIHECVCVLLKTSVQINGYNHLFKSRCMSASFFMWEYNRWMETEWKYLFFDLHFWVFNLKTLWPVFSKIFKLSSFKSEKNVVVLWCASFYSFTSKALHTFSSEA